MRSHAFTLVLSYIYGLVALLDNIQSSFSSITISTNLAAIDKSGRAGRDFGGLHWRRPGQASCRWAGPGRFGTLQASYTERSVVGLDIHTNPTTWWGYKDEYLRSEMDWYDLYNERENKNYTSGEYEQSSVQRKIMQWNADTQECISGIVGLKHDILRYMSTGL